MSPRPRRRRPNEPSESRDTLVESAHIMQLSLFDLDHTLLPLDSDYEWARFLIGLGVIDGARYEAQNERLFRAYQDGTLDIDESLAFLLAPLAAHPIVQLASWHSQFMDEVIRPAMRPSAIELVARHLERGDLCAVVTSTNEFVTAPIVREFGIEHLIATELELVAGRYTGRARGTPSFREGKVSRAEQWLAEMGHSFESFTDSWCYSDSINDLPLLLRVTRPVATNPDPRLAATAAERGWPTLQLFR